MTSKLTPGLATVSKLRQPLNRAIAMSAESLSSQYEAGQALVLAVAGVTAIMLIENLILMILY